MLPIHITSVTKGKYYIDKICTNMGGSKNAKQPNEKKRLFIIYQRTKVQKLGSPKNERVEKT
jgi:hypothetical protein